MLRRPAGGPSRPRPPQSSPATRAALLAAVAAVVVASVAAPALPVAEAAGVAPTIDYSHNMRVLKLPKSTKPGEIIYRLRGSDGDPNSQLHFGVAGIEGRALLEVAQVPGSWNEADVYLRARLDQPDGELGPELAGGQLAGELLGPLYAAAYNLTVYVADATNKTTQLDSTLLVTNDEQLEEAEGFEPAGDSEQRRYAFGADAPTAGAQAVPANSSAHGLRLPTLASMARVNSHLLSPFVRPRHVFGVPENGRPGESIGFLAVRESDKSDLPVRFELRGRGADHFAIRYVFGPRGQSRAELVLSQPVDYERQNLFQLKVLALNAWTNVRYDTRNVATLDIVVAVGDVQDTAPQFRELPRALRLSLAMRPGELVGRVQAEDGDYADQRPVGYALDAGSPLAGYFTIDKQSGEIRLLRSVQELSLNQHSLAAGGAGRGVEPASESMLQLSVFASELPDAASYDHLWPPMFARAELPLLIMDLANEPPQFIGGWLTDSAEGGLAVPTLRAFVREFANGAHEAEPPEPGADSGSPAQIVQWYTARNQSGELGARPDPMAALHQQLLRSSRGRPMAVDFGQGFNGTFELSLEGPDGHLFELEPAFPVSKQSLFNLYVAPGANRSLFDFDALAASRPAAGGGPEPAVRPFHVELVARDFGSPQRMSARLKCLIDLVDVNDNAPQFDTALYTFSVFENAQLGQVLGSIRARDLDRLSGLAGAQQQRVRYASLTGRDSHIFRLDQESGLITLEGPLDREKQDHYLLLAEARDTGGQAANYTKILVNVLDVNDNAPVFSQTHYDAVLLADGTFHQPLVVSATDADEPSSANSQVAYEIIAGNQNDQFAIDSLSGTIYPTGSGVAGAGALPTSLAPGSRSPPVSMPSILSEPILPFAGPRGKPQPDQHGKILPSPHAHSHEIEETTAPTGRQLRPGSPLHLNWPRSAPGPRAEDDRSPSALVPDLPRREDGRRQARDEGGAAPALTAADQRQQAAQSQRGLHAPIERDTLNGQQHFDASKVAPVTTLVIRAHDFGIPLRSATCKVNIYNQALLSRSLSVILNGTAEQLEQRRELIERSFGALTGSRAQIESIDALSDSSSISVARLRLAVPAGHSLIDLTDLSALMTAIDYKGGAQCPAQQQQQQQQHNLEQFRHPVHYIATADRIYPIHPAPGSSGNISAGVPSAGPTAIFTDIQSFDSASSMLERRLLFYIIIVGICILALLVIWMIYFCCREDQQQRERAKAAEPGLAGARGSRAHKAPAELEGPEPESARPGGAAGKKARQNKNKSSSRTHLMDEQHPIAKSASELNLDQNQQQLQQQQANKTQAKTTVGVQHPIGNNLLKQQQLSIPSNIKPEHYSMYNGQIWFDQSGPTGRGPAGLGERRASSAPSAGGHSLDSGLHAIITGRASALSPANSGLVTAHRGQFFPNALGYAENLATMGAPAGYLYPDGAAAGKRSLLGRRSLAKSRGRVVPMTMLGHGYANEAFERDFEPDGLVMLPFAGGGSARRARPKADRRHGHKSKAQSSSSSSASRSGSTRTLDEEDELDHESVLLDSDQELLGFDSTGTPIIATRTRNKPESGTSLLLAPEISPPVQDMGGASSPAATVINMSRDKAPAAAREAAPARRVEVKSVAPARVEKAEEAGPRRAAEAAPDGQSGVAQPRPPRGGPRQASGSKKEESEGGAAGDKSRQSLDLMSELNDRLSSANRQRALKRQSAEQNDESQQQQQQQADSQTDETAQAGPKPAAAGDIERPAAAEDASAASQAGAGRRASETLSCQSQSSMSDATTTTAADQEDRLRDMKNGELLEKQSIFALTYSGLATDKLPG